MFAINAALVRQFNAVKSKCCLMQSSVCNYFENMTENVHVCFQVHVEIN